MRENSSPDTLYRMFCMLTLVYSVSILAKMRGFCGTRVRESDFAVLFCVVVRMCCQFETLVCGIFVEVVLLVLVCCFCFFLQIPSFSASLFST